MSGPGTNEQAKERLLALELTREVENLAFLINSECWYAAEEVAVKARTHLQLLRAARECPKGHQLGLSFPPGGAVQGELVVAQGANQ